LCQEGEKIRVSPKLGGVVAVNDQPGTGEIVPSSRVPPALRRKGEVQERLKGMHLMRGASSAERNPNFLTPRALYLSGRMEKKGLRTTNTRQHLQTFIMLGRQEKGVAA